MQVLSIGRKKRIHAIAFSPSGRELAAACGDGLLRVWDLATGGARQSIAIEETSCGYGIAYLGEDRLAFAGIELRWWDIPANGWNRIRPGMLWGRQIRLSPDGRYLAEVDQTTSADAPGHGLHVYETDTWQEVPARGDTYQTTGGLAFSPDGRWLATGHLVRTGERRRYSRFMPGGFPVPEYDYLVHIREWPSGRVVHSPDGWQQGVSKLAFSPDGAFLIGTAGPRLRVWDVEGGCEVAVHQRGTKHFQGLAFTAGGRFLVTVSNDETVRVWEAQTWQEHRTFTWGVGKLLNIALDPEGFRAAAGSDRGQVVIWDLDDL
jgi:WD40 repeat protein